MMWYDGGWGWGGWFVMAVMMVLFWGLVIAGIAALVHYLGGTRRHEHPAPSGPAPQWGREQGREQERGQGREQARPEDLLAERFARGEIDEEEYQRRLAVLRDHR